MIQTNVLKDKIDIEMRNRDLRYNRNVWYVGGSVR